MSCSIFIIHNIHTTMLYIKYLTQMKICTIQWHITLYLLTFLHCWNVSATIFIIQCFVPHCIQWKWDGIQCANELQWTMIYNDIQCTMTYNEQWDTMIYNAQWPTMRNEIQWPTIYNAKWVTMGYNIQWATMKNELQWHTMITMSPSLSHCSYNGYNDYNIVGNFYNITGHCYNIYSCTSSQMTSHPHPGKQG